ncbi:hypothetical protein IWQ60_010201, partial [Tieghemiomyces parasiticus]
MTQPQGPIQPSEVPDGCIPRRVLFLREATETGQPPSVTSARGGSLKPLPAEVDCDRAAFATGGYNSYSLAVLQHRELNGEVLAHHLQYGPEATVPTTGSRYWGMVLTSYRTVNALYAALLTKVTDHHHGHQIETPGAPETGTKQQEALVAGGWQNAPVFVVGGKTARRYRSLFGNVGHVLGEETGNARQLLALIDTYVQDHRVPSHQTGRHTRIPLNDPTGLAAGPALLFPCSRIRLPTMINGLTDRGLNVADLPVYDTVADPTIPHRLRDLAEEVTTTYGRGGFTNATDSSAAAPFAFRWVAFFSPSGVDAALPAL